MSDYRKTPAELRTSLLARRDELFALAKDLDAADRRALGGGLGAELAELEQALEASDTDAVARAEDLLRDYERALDAARLAAPDNRRRQALLRRTLLITASLVLLVTAVRIGYVLKDYDAVVEACATHFHCTRTGECGVGIFHDGSLGIQLRCVADDPKYCEQPCREAGRCAHDEGGCYAAEAPHCQSSHSCHEHGRCTLGGRECVVGSDDDCADTVACRQHGMCRRANSVHCER